MKILRYYLLRAWRWVRIPLIIFALLYLGLLYSRARYDSTCVHNYLTISPSQGNFGAMGI